MDGLSNQSAGGIGVVLQSPEGNLIECTVLQFLTTNNEAEYEVVLTSLDLAKAVGALSIIIHNDSQVIVGNNNEDYETKVELMKEYLSMVKERENHKFWLDLCRSREKRMSKLTV